MFVIFMCAIESFYIKLSLIVMFFTKNYKYLENWRINYIQNVINKSYTQSHKATLFVRGV